MDSKFVWIPPARESATMAATPGIEPGSAAYTNLR